MILLTENMQRYRFGDTWVEEPLPRTDFDDWYDDGDPLSRPPLSTEQRADIDHALYEQLVIERERAKLRVEPYDCVDKYRLTYGSK